MDLKTTAARGYKFRLLLIAGACLFWAAYCVYDARLTYPEQIEIYSEYEKTKADYPETWNEVWLAKMKENGWPEQPKPRADKDIATQWIMFGVTFPIGIYCVFSLLKWSRRYVGADDDTLYSHGGVEVPFGQIARIDATRWENKGIARVYYDTGAGEQVVLIDDWKYDREPSDLIFSRIRENVDEDIIEGLDESEEASESEPEAA